MPAADGQTLACFFSYRVLAARIDPFDKLTRQMHRHDRARQHRRGGADDESQSLGGWHVPQSMRLVRAWMMRRPPPFLVVLWTALFGSLPAPSCASYKTVATRPHRARLWREPDVERALAHDYRDLPVPDEILCAILAACDPVDLVAARRVSRRWRACAPAIAKFKRRYVGELALMGYQSLLVQMRADGYRWRYADALTCASAAEGGHLALLQWLRSEGCGWDEFTCTQAASRGHIDIIKWAKANGCRWDKWTCYEAALGGHIEIVEWAYDHRCQCGKSGWLESAWDGAARGGHLHILRWAYECGHRCDGTTCATAAGRGDLAMLKWARIHGCPWTAIDPGPALWASATYGPSPCAEAAAGGHLDVLEWLHANGCPWDARACAAAAKGGHLDVLQWLYDKGCPWDWRTCADAAKGDRLDILRWARDKGCLWNEQTCASAAKSGHIDIIQWARSEGCPWDKGTCAAAAGRGQLDTLIWLKANGCPWGASACQEAATGGHLDVLKWLRANGCPWDVWTWRWARPYDHVVKWVEANGCPRDDDGHGMRGSFAAPRQPSGASPLPRDRLSL